MKFKDYYAALEVPRDADADTIKKAYRKLARKYHPDVSKESNAEARFKDVAEAYETLKDPDKRAAYDQLGQRPAGQEFSAPPDWRERYADAGGAAGFEDLDLADLLDSLVRGANARSRRPSAGQDYDITAELDLEDAMRGTTLHLALQRPEGPETLEVTVPPGVVDGQKLRLRGRGGPGRGGGPAGDIYVHLKLRPHPRFRVTGRDLYFDLVLAPWEAALGAEVQVPTMTGDVLLQVPPGSHSGRKLRLRGRGLGSLRSVQGDLYAVVTIDVPGELTTRERELFEELARESRFDPRTRNPREGSR